MKLTLEKLANPSYAGTGTIDRGGLPRSKGAVVPLPEWRYLFTPEEWHSLNPIDREEVKRTIVALSLWVKVDDLPKLFNEANPSPYKWNDLHVATRLEFLLHGFYKEQLPRVEIGWLDDQVKIWYLYNDRTGQRMLVFDYESLISQWVETGRLYPNF